MPSPSIFDSVKPTYTIRDANAHDAGAMHALITELAAYEREPDAVRLTVEQLREDGWGPDPAFSCFVAEENGKVQAMALYHFAYSTWNGRALYLEDLIVTEAARGSGVGKALMQELSKRALEKGCVQMRWQVLDWNTPALAFYRAIGADLDATWENGRLDPTQMTALSTQ